MRPVLPWFVRNRELQIRSHPHPHLRLKGVFGDKSFLLMGKKMVFAYQYLFLGNYS
jgi:hypothetical protein